MKFGLSPENGFVQETITFLPLHQVSKVRLALESKNQDLSKFTPPFACMHVNSTLSLLAGGPVKHEENIIHRN